MNFEKFQRYEQQALSTVYSEVPGGTHWVYDTDQQFDEGLVKEISLLFAIRR